MHLLLTSMMSTLLAIHLLHKLQVQFQPIITVRASYQYHLLRNGRPDVYSTLLRHARCVTFQPLSIPASSGVVHAHSPDSACSNAADAPDAWRYKSCLLQCLTVTLDYWSVWQKLLLTRLALHACGTLLFHAFCVLELHQEMAQMQAVTDAGCHRCRLSQIQAVTAMKPLTTV